MSDEVRDPAEEFEDMDIDNIDMGFTDEDLDDVVDSVRGDRFQYSGVQCRVRKESVDTRPNDSITASRQEFWMAGVKVSWDKDLMLKAQQLFESHIHTADEMDGWVEVRVGHERAVSREEAENEAEWLAEQVVMLRNDPNTPI